MRITQGISFILLAMSVSALPAMTNEATQTHLDKRGVASDAKAFFKGVAKKLTAAIDALKSSTSDTKAADIHKLNVELGLAEKDEIDWDIEGGLDDVGSLIAANPNSV